MSIDNFAGMMISLEQGSTHSSVKYLWPQQLISGTENKELAFQETELQVLFETICSFSPPLQTLHLGYSPLNDCHSCHHENASPAPSRRDGYHAPGLRATHEANPLQLEPSPLTELKKRCSLSESSLTAPQHGNPTVEPSHHRQGALVPINDNLSSPTCEVRGVQPRFTNVVAPAVSQKQFPDYHSICSLRRIRKKRSRFMQPIKGKSLQTIPENQEWRLPDEHSKVVFKCAMLESSELKSVFENDSDSEDESEDF